MSTRSEMIKISEIQANYFKTKPFSFFQKIFLSAEKMMKINQKNYEAQSIKNQECFAKCVHQQRKRNERKNGN